MSSYDTILGVYSGELFDIDSGESLGSDDIITSNDDSCVSPNTVGSLISSVVLEGGVTYYIVVVSIEEEYKKEDVFHVLRHYY